MRHLLGVISLLWVLVSLGGVVYAQTDERDEYGVHVVQRGENLFRIALSYGLTTEELASLNGIVNPASIQVGQRLLVPGTLSPPTTSEPTIIATTPAEQVNTPTETIQDYVIHTVQRGETLFRIATGYGTTVNEIATANNLSDPTRIFSGQQLIIPNIEPPTLNISLPPIVETLQVNPSVFMEGRTGRVRLVTNTSVTVEATFINQSITAISSDDGLTHTLLIGIPVFTDTNTYPLDLSIVEPEQDAVGLRVDIQVVGGGYGSERINLVEGRDNLLNENVEQAELDLLQNVTVPVTPVQYLDQPLGLPAAAAITSQFGTRRSYNGGAFNRFHSGTDFAGAPGTAIIAPAPGRVVMADTLNVRGNATMIDHGWGIYTGYWHQTEMYVQPGDEVETGQVIGTIGSTGRVTGAHLHWELWVNGVPVDPMQWVQQTFLGDSL